MAWILSTIWSGLLYGLRSVSWFVPRTGVRSNAGSRPSGSPAVDAVVQARGVYPPWAGAGVHASGVNVLGACAPSAGRRVKRFYTLMIEVRPAEADAETLQVFLDGGCYRLAAMVNLPTGCELRRCMDMSPEMAEMLIKM